MLDSLQKPYGYQFSRKIVLDFFSARARGILILAQLYPNVNIEHAIALFRYNQRRWNLFKKLTKLCERLSYNKNYDLSFIKQRCLTSVKYYLDWEDGKTGCNSKKQEKPLDNNFRGV
jgi:hypothetical protein